MSIQEHISKLAKQTIEEKGWKPFNDFKVEIQPGFHLGAHISFKDWKIALLTPENLYELIEEVVNEEELDLPPNLVLEADVYTSMVHEHSHFLRCPKNKEGLERILSGSYEAIKHREHDPIIIKKLCYNIHNLFSDTILDTINAHVDVQKEKYRYGRDVAHLINAYHTLKFAKMEELPYHPNKALALFYRSCHLLQDRPEGLGNKMKKYLPKFFLGYERHTRRVMNIFTGDEHITQAAFDRNLSEEQIDYMVRRMEDVSLWKKMAFEYTNVVYPFMRNFNEQLDNSFTRNREDEKEQGEKKKTSKSKKKNQSENPGSGQEGKLPDFMNQGGEKKSPGENLEGTLQDIFGRNQKRRLNYLQNYSLLDTVYKERAGKLALFAEEAGRKSPSFMHHPGLEPMPLDEFNIRDVQWTATRYKGEDENAEVILYRKSNPLLLPIPVEDQPWGIPDISFILDSSFSMGFKPQPHKDQGEGEYHLAVLTFYSIINYLEEIGIAPLLNYNMMNFSSETVDCGWQPYHQLDKVKKALFDYQGGGTTLDPRRLQLLRNTRLDNFLCFMLTDGGFNSEKNTEQIVQEVELMQATGGIGFFLFHLGNPNAFSQALEYREVPVTYITRAEDFMDKTLTFTKDLYGAIS